MLDESDKSDRSDKFDEAGKSDNLYAQSRHLEATESYEVSRLRN